MGGRDPGDSAARARNRHSVIVRLQVALAALWVLLAPTWWFADGATWQPPVFTVLGIAYLVSAVASLREHQRREAGGRRSPGGP